MIVLWEKKLLMIITQRCKNPSWNLGKLSSENVKNALQLYDVYQQNIRLVEHSKLINMLTK